MQNNNLVHSDEELELGAALLFMSDSEPVRLPGMTSEEYLRLRIAWGCHHLKGIIRESMKNIGIEPLALFKDR